MAMEIQLGGEKGGFPRTGDIKKTEGLRHPRLPRGLRKLSEAWKKLRERTRRAGTA